MPRIGAASWATARMNSELLRIAGAQLLPLNDCPKVHPLRFFAKNARERARQCVWFAPVEVACSCALSLLVPADVAGRQSDEQCRNPLWMRIWHRCVEVRAFQGA